MKFYLFNENVCIRLKLFGEDLKNLLSSNGWKETTLQDADYIFINSCSFLNSKESFFLKKIQELDSKTDKNICVFGCLPQTSSEKILTINSKILLFNRDINLISKKLNLTLTNTSLSHSTRKVLSLKGKIVYLFNKFLLKNPSINYRLNKEKVFHLNISRGCLGKCTYCSEKFTTSLKSRKISEVLNSFHSGLDAGYKIFSLNSDDTSCFGKDNKEDIYSLLKEMLAVNKDFNLVITEFNPQGLTDKVINLLSSKKIIFITIPIQSGSQKILNKMKRPYKISPVIKKLKEIKKLNPSLKINTHLIVGFPGESKNDFNKTIALSKTGLFDRVKIFEYNDRPGTEASLMKRKISFNEKIKRKKYLKLKFILSDLKHFSLSNILMEIVG